MVNQEIARSGRLEPTAHLAVELLQGRLQFAVIKRVFCRIGIGGMNGFVGVCCHLLECARRGPDVGVDAEGMFVAVVVVCTAALNQLDAAAQVDDALGLLELREQRVLEVDESHAEICRARFMRANWRGVGSKVSGLAPAGTSTSMSKSEPTMPPMIVRNGRIETTIVRSSVRGVSPHAASSRGVTSRRRYFLMVDVSCDKDKKNRGCRTPGCVCLPVASLVSPVCAHRV